MCRTGAFSGWSWEIFWLTGGVVLLDRRALDLRELSEQTICSACSAARRGDVLFWCYFWGALWGIGGLTFGLTMRYLGLSLGMAVALGFTTIIGTLGPPIFRGTLAEVAATTSGKITLLGLAMTLAGVIVVGKAGRAKESDLKGSGASAGVAEFSLNKGLLIALLSGVMSGCFAWGLDAGKSIRELSLAAGTDPLAQGLPVLCVVLLGGFTTNFIWCAYLIYRNRSVGEFVGRPGSRTIVGERPRLWRNYLLAAFGGTLWYLQFFFYTMGESQMGRYAFSSWTLHMASIILFSTLWGFALKEWSGASSKTRFSGVVGYRTAGRIDSRDRLGKFPRNQLVLASADVYFERYGYW